MNNCNNDIIYDYHHIIPKYMGGSDESENLVKVTRTSHTIFHYCNYILWGNKEDYIAYRGLSGQLKNQELILEKSRLAGKKSFKNKTGIFSLSKSERILASARGGKKASKYMSNSMWINNGIINKRVKASDIIEEGFIKGRIKKEKIKIEKKDSYLQIKESRLEYLKLKNFDLNSYGIISKIARDWNISRTQVVRFLKKNNLR